MVSDDQPPAPPEPLVTELFGGVKVGHWTNKVAATGCTVIVFPESTVASGVVRGGAPATREFELLDPARLVEYVDAVVLSGGSAFGLAAADGVVTALEQAGRGYPTGFGRVPIVVGMSLYDLGVGDASVRPTAADGTIAYDNASSVVSGGRVGAGVGATVAKWTGAPKPGGIGVASLSVDDIEVCAIIAVNAFGPIDDGRSVEELGPPMLGPLGESTTIGVVFTNAAVSKRTCRKLADAAHDGFARALLCSHSDVDGDAIVVASLPSADPDARSVVDLEGEMWLRVLVQTAVERAIRSVV